MIEFIFIVFKHTIWSMFIKLKYPIKVWNEDGQAKEKPKERLVMI